MAEPLYRANVLICGGTGCTSSESLEVIRAMTGELSRRGLEKEVRVVQTGCRGFCAMGPVMMIYPEGIFYCQVQPRDVQTIVEETLVKGRVVGRLTYKGTTALPGNPFLQQASPHYPSKLWYHRSRKDRRIHRARRLRRPLSCPVRYESRRSDRRNKTLRFKGPRRRGVFHRDEMGVYGQSSR